MAVLGRHISCCKRAAKEVQSLGPDPASEQIAFVLSGELTSHDDGGNELVAGSGRTVVFPVNVPHGAHSKGAEHAACLVATAPPID